jgi:hypothetical protein
MMFPMRLTAALIAVLICGCNDESDDRGIAIDIDGGQVCVMELKPYARPSREVIRKSGQCYSAEQLPMYNYWVSET